MKPKAQANTLSDYRWVRIFCQKWNSIFDETSDVFASILAKWMA